MRAPLLARGSSLSTWQARRCCYFTCGTLRSVCTRGYMVGSGAVVIVVVVVVVVVVIWLWLWLRLLSLLLLL